jgi:hypothetical protein
VISGIREREAEGKIAALRRLAQNPTPEGAQLLLERWDDDYYRDPKQWRAQDELLE